MIHFRPFRAADLTQVIVQPSQHVCLGMTRPVRSIEDGELFEAAGDAWTAIAADGRVLTCAGFTELWPGRHAVAWATLAKGIGAAHLAITRFARERIAESPLTRIEAIVRAEVAAECKWAQMVGLNLAAVLRAWGPEGETHLLFERIREAG